MMVRCSRIPDASVYPLLVVHALLSSSSLLSGFFVGVSAASRQSLMDLIETSRSQWFEVATQFRAIFLSDSSGTAAAISAASDGYGHLRMPSARRVRCSCTLACPC